MESKVIVLVTKAERDSALNKESAAMNRYALRMELARAPGTTKLKSNTWGPAGMREWGGARAMENCRLRCEPSRLNLPDADCFAVHLEKEVFLAQVGYDKYSYAYRDLEGTKVGDLLHCCPIDLHLQITSPF